MTSPHDRPTPIPQHATTSAATYLWVRPLVLNLQAQTVTGPIVAPDADGFVVRVSSPTLALGFAPADTIATGILDDPDRTLDDVLRYVTSTKRPPPPLA